jgi:beta-lactamase regulating signal transducer with metallopeptidase domain
MNPWMQATGWTLIHFVWQGGLLALATAVGLRLCRRRSPEVRYAIACAGLTAMLASAVATAALYRATDSALVSADNIRNAVAAGTLPRISTDDVPSSINGAAAVPTVPFDAVLSSVVWGWLAGVTALLVRFAGGCWRVRRLRTAALAEAVSQWQSAGERLAVRLRLDVPFRVVESALVDAPGVIGIFRPVILLPVAALANLAPAQIEAILAHELAHVRRRDYAVNLLQTVAETLLFYHPAVWWVSARVREEREHCCDDVAVEICGEPAAYAAALAELASHGHETALAVGATDGPLVARVRRLLRAGDDDGPRPVAGLVILALGLPLAAGLAVQASTSRGASDGTARGPGSAPPAYSQTAPGATQLTAGDRRIHKTDHFDIYYKPDLDLHAERVGHEAERAYGHVSADLKHSLAFSVPIVLFHTTSELEQEVQTARLGTPHAASFADPSRDRILLAIDRPADQWYGIITHQVTHIFGFDIIPGASTPRWLMEGLAEYERGAWDPSNLVALREAVRGNAIPQLSGLDAVLGNDSRLVYALGHAAFDFIESRWGKAGVRQFLFALRQAALNGGDPYAGALQLKQDEFARAFELHLKERFAGSAGHPAAETFDRHATIRIEGNINTINFSASAGFACVELWGLPEAGIRRRWAVECEDQKTPEVLRALKLGDRVIVTGPPARRPGAQRLVMHSLQRPSDGFAWRAHSG